MKNGTLRRMYGVCAASKWLKAVIVLFCASAISFFVVREVFFKTLVFGDNPLVTLNSGAILKEYVFDSWHMAAFGENSPSPLTYLFLYIFGQSASYVGTIAFFNFLMSLSIPLSFISFYIFSKKFSDNFWTRIFGSVFYVVNPIVITYYNFGGFMWALVFLPLSLSFFVGLLEKQTNRNIAKAAFFTVLTMWVFPHLSVILILTLGTITLSYIVLASKKSGFLKTVFPRLVVFLAVVVLCNASYLYAEYSNYQSPSFGYQSTSVLNDFKSTYQSMSLPNMLTFAGNAASPQVPLGYLDSSRIQNEISLIIPIMAFASIFLLRKFPMHKKRVVAMLVSLAFIASFTLLISYVAHSQLSWIITNIPPLWTLRNPIKLQLMLAVCMIPLFIFSIEKTALSAISFLRRRNLMAAALTLSLVLLGLSQVYVYNAFAFEGYMGLNVTYGSYTPNRTLLRIVNDSMQWYGDRNYRGIILPFDHNAELHVQFTNPLLYPGTLGVTTEVTNVLNAALATDTDLKSLFSLLGIKYVYVNNEWTDTGFPIVEPANLTDVARELAAENVTKESFGSYSKFTIDTALPHLYLSNYPVFYSNIETLGLLNSSIFQAEPIFFKMKCSSGRYEWESPIGGMYNVYAVAYSDNNKIPILYALDGGKIANDVLNLTDTVLQPLGQIELNSGGHNMLLVPNDTASFIGKEFVGEGSWNVKDGQTTIVNGEVLTSEEYGKFDLNLKFKPVTFGKEGWNSPDVFFGWNSSCYFRIIFHKDGEIEIAKETNYDYLPGIVTVQSSFSTQDWNDLRVMNNGHMLTLYLNGKNVLTYSDQSVGGKGKIGIGSDSSTTDFENITVSRDTVAGVFLLPTNQPQEIPITVLKTSPDDYSLTYNQTQDSSVLYLGEGYDSGWEASIDGLALDGHSQANLYGNGWVINNTSQGTHEINICYTRDNKYQLLLYADMAVMVALPVVASFPKPIIENIRSYVRKRRKQMRRLNTCINSAPKSP